MTLEELMQEIVDMSHEERVELGKSCVDDILEAVGGSLNKEEYADFIFSIIKLFVCADKVCSQEEYELIRDIYSLDMSYDTFYEIVKNGLDPAFVSKMDRLIDTLTPDLKRSICLFGLCILGSDDTITVAEQDLFNRILD